MLLRVRAQDEAAGKGPPPAPASPPGADASDEEKADYALKEFPKLKAILDYVFGKNDPDKTQ